MSDKPLSVWIIFIALVLGLLIFDLGVLHRKNRVMSLKESLYLSFFYMAIGLAFSLWIWHLQGFEGFAQYLTAYLVEKTLAIDNVYLISAIFTTLSIPTKYQHRVLFWGILGVIILRGIMIYLGALMIAQFQWVLYIFSIIMIITGIKMFFMPNQQSDMSQNRLLLWLKSHLPMTNRLHDEHFFIYKKDGDKKKLLATPLFLALVFIECIDLIFAIDSIPAVFAITQDSYIVYTSNIFAILGLRALYFALAAIILKFYYLKYALATVLIFIGSKIFIADALGLVKIPPVLSLLVTLSLLASGIIFSVFRKQQ